MRKLLIFSPSKEDAGDEQGEDGEEGEEAEGEDGEEVCYSDLHAKYFC